MTDYGRFFGIALSVFLCACGGGGGKAGGGEPEPVPLTQYSVSVSVGEGGSVSPSSAVVESGRSVSFSIEADAGYEVTHVEGCGGTLDGMTYSTASITADCEITAEFAVDGPVDSDSPSASIQFPWPVSRTSASTITVRGVAADSTGAIRSVRINGVEATLSRRSQESLLDVPTANYSAPEALLVGGSDDVSGASESGDSVEWEVEIPIGGDEETFLQVEAEDDSGNVEVVADAARIISRETPTDFIVDRLNRTLIGITNTHHIVKMGLDDGSYQSIPLVNNEYYCGGKVTRGTPNELICTSIRYRDDVLKVFSVSLESGEQQLLGEHDLELDPAIWDSAYPQVARVSDDGTSIYILVYALSTNESVESKNMILRYDFADSQFAMIVDAETDTGKPIQGLDLNLVDDGILVFSDGWLGKVDYMGADLQVIAALKGEPPRIEVNAAQDTAYLANTGVISSVGLVTGQQGEEFVDDEELLYTTNLLDSAGLDEANNRLLIGDVGYDYIYAMDVDTGVRTEFAANSVGTGKHLTSASAIELDEENGIAYVLDDGGNSGEVLFRVDLSTGDRTVLARFDLGCFNTAQDLVLDSDGQRIFAVFYNVIHAVDLETGSINHIAPESETAWCGGHYSFTGATLDAANNRILVTESQSDALMSVDLTTYALSTVYTAAEISGPADVELDEGSGTIYIASETNGALFAVDEESGESELLTDSCFDDDGADLFEVMYGGIRSIYLDAVQPVLWVSASGRLIRYDLESAVCTSMPWLDKYGDSLNNEYLVDIELTQSGQIIGVQNLVNSQIVQVDFSSGDIVTIAR